MLKFFADRPQSESDYQRRANLRRGFITLLATLIFGAVGLAVAVTLLAAGVSATQNNLTLEQSLQARTLAAGCAEDALWQIHKNEFFIGIHGLNLATGSCLYIIADAGPGIKTIQASASVSQIIQKLALTVQVSSSTVTVNTWQEIP